MSDQGAGAGNSKRKQKSSDESHDSEYINGGSSAGKTQCVCAHVGNLLTLVTLAYQAPTIEEFAASKDPFRQVVPGFAQRMPLRAAVCSQAAADAYRQFVEPHIRQILSSTRVPWQSISLRRQIPVGNEGTHDIDSLVVQTSCEDPSAMKQAAQKLFERFQLSDLSTKKIEVEIRNQARWRHRTSHRLTDDHVVQEMQRVKPMIMKQVRSICRESWSSVAFHNRSSRNAAGHIPTVIVFCLPGTRANFEKLESISLAALYNSRMPIGLEILPGFVTDCLHGVQNFALSMPDIPSRPQNGASIGARGNKFEAGTLGGWMSLTPPNQKPIPVALTCYHVIRSYNNPSLAHATDQYGIKMSDSDQIRALVEYPAALDRNFTAQRLAGMPDERAQFLGIADHPIGRVLAASGYQVNKANRRMDWALIESPATYGKNLAPNGVALNQLQLPPLGSYDIGKGFIIQETAAFGFDNFAIKKGRTSGITSGLINKMDRVVKWPNLGGVETEEIELVGLGADFADSGDSGSFVTDVKGRLVGMLFAKDACASDCDIGFMTPICDLQDNVKETTGAALSLA